MEKQASQTPLLPQATSRLTTSSKKPTKRSPALIALFLLLGFLGQQWLSQAWTSIYQPTHNFDALKDACPQPEPLLPSAHNVSSVWNHKERIIKWHQGAIRIPTEVQDVMGEPGEDRRWDIFADFHEYLEKSYPLVHKNLKRTKVDTYGLVFEWFGSDPSLQPLFLAAHQDVVPVLSATIPQWKQPPFGGVYDGKYIWGRGSSDDKSGLTSIMAGIELLLETTDFKPTRTVVLGFGHDEERGGYRGAPAIRDWALKTYGKDSMAMIVDEGSGLTNDWGQQYAIPAVAEKGRMNLQITVSTLGGHSSVPPVHTGIGFLALLIAKLEANPHPVRLEKSSPVWGFLQCAAVYSPEMPKPLKAVVMDSAKGSLKAFKKLPEVLIKYGMGGKSVGGGMGDPTYAMLHTTQAVDIINGGVKVNALPEVVTVVINHRVDVAANCEITQKHIIDTLLPEAKKLNLGLEGFGFNYTPKSPSGKITLGTTDPSLDPAPITPTGPDDVPYQLLGSTARGMWASRPAVSKDGQVVALAKGDDLVMAPFMSSGNTDTRRYWDLTRHIFRFRYFEDGTEPQNAHTINEHVAADSIVEFTRFYQALILNVDSNKGL